MPSEYVARANKYAINVVIGLTPACAEVRAACQRYLATPDGYHIDEECADRPCKFIENLKHVKGKWAGEFIRLADWQVFVVVNLFGVIKTSTGKRKYRVAYIKVPRKNGKSTLMAGIGLYMLCADGESGAEVYCGATSQKQALEVFKPAQKMVLNDPELRDYFGVEALASNINVLSSNSKFEPVIGKPGDGPSPSLAIVDEYHEHNDADQFDAFDTGQGSREEPMIIVITTAGDNIGGPCYEMEDSAHQIVMGTMIDETMFVLMYGLDPDDESRWDTMWALKKANPNFGISCDEEYLAGKLNSAKQRPGQRGIFKTKHLNKWVGARDAYFDIEAWRAAGDPSLRMDDYIGRPCRIGIDLASKIDLVVMVVLFPPLPPPEEDEPEYRSVIETNWIVFPHFYVSEARAEDEANKHYRGWCESGMMTATPGNITDYDFIADDLRAIYKKHDVIDVAYDPYQATWLSTTMMKEGMSMVEFGPTVLNFSEPMKDLDAHIRKGIVKHDGNLVMEWNIGNTTAKADRKDNVFPNKNKDEQKIDGTVALIMAIGRCIADTEPKKISVYEERGVLSV